MCEFEGRLQDLAFWTVGGPSEKIPEVPGAISLNGPLANLEIAANAKNSAENGYSDSDSSAVSAMTVIFVGNVGEKVHVDVGKVGVEVVNDSAKIDPNFNT